MTGDPLAEIDRMLAEELPEATDDAPGEVEDRRRGELIQLLQHGAEELGESPTLREFNELDFETSADVIADVFGTWNRAKEAAGLRTFQRGTVREIDESYFERIDTPATAYWFGTLVATSSLQAQEFGSSHQLVLGRTEEKRYFVTAFARAVGSDYPIRRHRQNKSDNLQYQLHVSNPTFVEHLIDAGYPAPGGEMGGFPDLDETLRAPFLRGFLESSGYFSTGGWNVSTSSPDRAETLQEWFEEFGAKRPTVSKQVDGRSVVRVANVFDIRAVFETLWPDRLDTDPCFRPYPERILEHLAAEYPYPENVPYLEE
jgi:hypothetical protein